MNWRMRKASAALLLASLVAGSGATALPEKVGTTSFAPATAQSLGLSCAKVADVHGTVYKAELVDQSKSEFGSPEPASKNDLLYEGSVVGTGRGSWAELQWPDVITRIWHNSVVQIRQNGRQVFLQNGKLTFRLDKNRKDKAAVYDVRTKVLQARIHGTTIRLEDDATSSRVAVLEGAIDVKNLVNNSMVHLTPGVVLEIKKDGTVTLPATYDLRGVFKEIPELKSELPGNNKDNDIATSDVRLSPKKGELIFKDKYTTTQAFTANSKAILEDPMVVGMGGQLDSYPLIRDSMERVPGFSLPDMIEQATSKVDRNITKNLTIRAVPSRTSYFIGPNVGESMKLPAVAYSDLRPQGKIENIKIPSNIAAMPVRPAVPIFHPTLDTPSDIQSLSDIRSNLSQFSGVATQLPAFQQPAITQTAIGTQTVTQASQFTPQVTAITPIPTPVPHITPFGPNFMQQNPNIGSGLFANNSNNKLSDNSLNVNVGSITGRN